jgi:hypothetical protein
VDGDCPETLIADTTMVKVPDVPKGKELEDFVAALLQCTHHFVEKNIKEPDVLELDVVATSYGKGSPEQCLFEVKSGKWGFSDILKLRGQMEYLSICRGALISTQAPQDKSIGFYRKRCNKINIDLRIIGDLQRARDDFSAAGYGQADELLHELWRFSFWIERRLLEVLRKEAKTKPDAEAPREALRYYTLINDGLFMTEEVTQRVAKLYEAYQNHPKLTLGAAREMSGGAFDPVTEGDPLLLRDALLSGHHKLLQACMYLEHRARLSILKAATDYLCQPPEQVQPSAHSITVDFGLVALPRNFLTALSELRQQPYFWLYPLFWQVFLWGWGGFILNDREEEETEGLSAQTGLPAEYVPAALEAFDKLFPTPNGWLAHMPTASYRLVKMVPWPFCGLGAWQRLKRYKADSYRELGLTGLFTVKDLAKRHNSCYELLSQSESV